MSVDTVIAAISKVRRNVIKYPDHFSETAQRKVLAILDCMRDPLMKEDVEGFNRYVDDVLGREPDAADYVLEDLFDALMLKDRDALSKELAEV